MVKRIFKWLFGSNQYIYFDKARKEWIFPAPVYNDIRACLIMFGLSITIIQFFFKGGGF